MKILLASFIYSTLLFLLFYYIAMHFFLMPARSFRPLLIESIVVGLITAVVTAYFLNRRAKSQRTK
jgi:hypothetical protein